MRDWKTNSELNMESYVNKSGRASRRSFGGYAVTHGRKPARSRGFTLLELMIVISVMMILIAVAVPAYNQHIIKARESVMLSNMQALNNIIQQYTEDNGKAPQSLDDLVSAHYLREIPKDPLTGAADWDPEPEDPSSAADPQQPGIVTVHSHAPGMGSNNQAYSEWK
jgi:general secretion pathway protein G